MLAASEGALAPEVTATFLNGEKFSLRAEKGHVVLIHFWATWCDACVVEMPILDAFYKKYRSQGLKVIAINMDSPVDLEKVKKRMAEYSFDTALAQSAVFKDYGRIWRLPLNFLVDRAGILRKDGWVSSHTLTSEDLEKVIPELLEKKN